MLKTGILFDSEGIKSETKEIHEAVRKELDRTKQCLNQISIQIDTVIREKLKKAMSGSYAKAFDSECTEIKEDITKLIQFFTDAETELTSTIARIESTPIRDTLSLNTVADYINIGPFCGAGREIITNMQNIRIEQQVSIIQKKITLTPEQMKAYGIVRPAPFVSNAEFVFPAVAVSLQNHAEERISVAEINGKLIEI